MSPAGASFQLLQGGRGAAVRFEVLNRIRSRWGAEAAQGVGERIAAGTDAEAKAWLRRSAYFLDLPSMLDLERTLPVSLLRIQDLLDLLAADDHPALSLILLRFASLSSQSWPRAERIAPWLEDLPHSRRAIQHLYGQGWLLIGCGQREQARAISQSVVRGRGILASRYDLG